MTKETVLITGGTSIVGQAVIPVLIANGYDVVFTSRTQKIINSATCIAVDLLTENGVKDLLAALISQNIKVTHLINNFRDVDNYKTDENSMPSRYQWHREFDAAVVIPSELVIGLAEQGLKSVVNVASIYGLTVPNLNLYDGNIKGSAIHYNVTKAAEIHMTKDLAVRLAKQKIRVNAIAYGGIKGRAPKEFEDKYQHLCPFGGMLESEDLYGAMLFLINEKLSAKITGQTIQVDGGWTLW
jgi:NAD(P)-dependent dehydrogenase (short-subunit alcohol dehydrogenase family)